MIFNMIYSDGKSGKSFVKRFAIPAIIRDKEYDLGQNNPNSRVHYLSANPNGEAEVVEIKLTASSSARKKIFEFDFSELEVKGRGARGNTLTKYPIRKVDFKESGGSTLGGLELWYDDASGKLNKDTRGKFLGKFNHEDKIITFTRGGTYRISGFDLTTRFEAEKTLNVEKFNPKKVVSAVYWDGQSKQPFVKRFQIETITPDKEFGFISEAIGSRLEFATQADNPELEIEVVKGKSKSKQKEVINLEDVIDVKGWKAMGNRLSTFKVTKISAIAEEEEIEAEVEEPRKEKVKKKRRTATKAKPNKIIRRSPKSKKAKSQKNTSKGKSKKRKGKRK